MSQGEFRGYGCPTRIILQPEQANRIHFRDFLELFVEGEEAIRLHSSRGIAPVAAFPWWPVADSQAVRDLLLCPQSSSNPSMPPPAVEEYSREGEALHK